MKMLLVAPNHRRTRNADFFPLGIAYLAAWMKAHGFEPTCLNLNHHDHELHAPLLRETLLRGDFAYVGVGGLSHHLESIKRVLDIVREHAPGLPLVVGGGGVSSDPEVVMPYLGADFGVVGEGEIPLLHLTRHLAGENISPEEIGGLVFRHGGEWRLTGPGQHVRELDSLPYPDLDGLGVDDYIGLRSKGFSTYAAVNAARLEAPLCASRSCPFKCTFCFHPLGDAYRERSNASLVDEIAHLHRRYGIGHVTIYAELFASKKAKIMDFCDRMRADGLDVSWSCQLRVDEIDQEVLSHMKAAGCTFLSLGFESGSDTILRSMRKGIRTRQIEQTVELIRKARISMQANFLYGDPAETPETVAETNAFKRRMNLNFVQWTHVIPYPGTALYKQSVARGLIPDRLAFTLDLPRNKALNMTTMPDELHRKIFNELWDFNEQHKRERRLLATGGEDKGALCSTVSGNCAVCGGDMEISVLYPPEANGDLKNASAPLAVAGVTCFCPDCGRRNYIFPSDIPHVRPAYQAFQAAIDRAAQEQVPVYLTPAIQKLDLFLGLGVDFGKLRIKAFLDNDPAKIGGTALGVPVLDRSGFCAPDGQPVRVFVLPSPYYSEIVEDVVRSGVLPDCITCWDETVLQALGSPHANQGNPERAG